MPKAHKTGSDRRAHYRFPVCEGLIEPITVKFGEAKSKAAAQPAILTNLSAGGMSLLMFLAPPSARRLDMVMTLPGLAEVPVQGKVVRVHQKGETFSIGIAFTKISKKHQSKINAMAHAYIDCDIRMALKLPDARVCVCKFHSVNGAPRKSPSWLAKK